MFYYLGIEEALECAFADPKYWEGRDSLPRNRHHHHTLFGSKVVEVMDGVLGKEAENANLHEDYHHPMYDADTTFIMTGEDSGKMYNSSQRGTNIVVAR